MKQSLKEKACNKHHPLWENFIQREAPLPEKKDELRSDFMRDYTRILHSDAYRRLKHKTQVFFNPKNDHVCTRIEHVQHVESVANTIAEELGLNVELTKAIATGHDLGHSPFGHTGEKVISELAKENGLKNFWHEKNGLHFVDNIEHLSDDEGNCRNLNLTYAVRDGIISHCGEVDSQGIMPRNEIIDLYSLTTAGAKEPATYEGAVVKISDKIAYLGRDIEDAKRLGFIEGKAKTEFDKISESVGGALNTTNLMHKLILDVVENSNSEKGIALSQKSAELIKRGKEFNYEYIYGSSRLLPYTKYAKLILTELFNKLKGYYDKENTIRRLKSETKQTVLIKGFTEHLENYSLLVNDVKPLIKKPYGKLESQTLYTQAVIDYFSGMTDGYVIQLFEELITVN